MADDMGGIVLDGRAVWEATGHRPEDFDSYVADHGAQAVRDDLLRTIAFHSDEVLRLRDAQSGRDVP